MTETITLFGHIFNLYAIIIFIMGIGFLFALYRAHKANNINWLDAVTAIDQTSGARELSIAKIIQIVGGVTATFIVIKLSLQNTITPEIFLMYLAYTAAIDGFTKFMLAKYGVVTPPTPPVAPVAPTTPNP
jgi:hypothetical protein